MFVGAINTDLRSIIAALAPAWKGLAVHVGCSGNFTIERILGSLGLLELHSNDVSLYSCSIGHYLAGEPFYVTVKDDRLAWLEPFLAPGIPTITTLLLCTTMLQYWDRDNPYHRRMFGAYKTRFADLHAKTLAKLENGLKGLTPRSLPPSHVLP